MSQRDRDWMQRALMLATHGIYTTHPNPNVGCVLVDADGVVVGEGWHHKAGEPHAEVHALRQAGLNARGATAYVTLEPCSHFGRTPPCALALIEAGVKRVVVAMQDPNPLVAGRGLQMLQQAGIAVCCGVMQAEAEAINLGFLKRMRTGLPYVRLKLAASLDGRTALANGQSQWITGPAARRDVQAWRARSSVILSGADTVLSDNPSLNVRWDELPAEVQSVYPYQALRQPLRVLVDGRGRIPASAKLFSLPGEVLVARQQAVAAWPQALTEWIGPTADNGKLDLQALMQELGRRGCNEVWVEAGRKLAGALLQAGLVDELLLYLAPKVLGDSALGLLHIAELDSLAQAPQLIWHDVQQIGDDLRLTLRPAVKEK